MVAQLNEKTAIYLQAYEMAAHRYENLYKAVWTNFSYMTFVSAGIITFGSDRFYLLALLWAALMPLLFWYFVSFIPLDSYGQDQLRHLAEIEEKFLSEFGAEVRHFRRFKDFRSTHRRKRVAPRLKAIMQLLFFVWLALTATGVYKLCKGHSFTTPRTQGVTISVPHEMQLEIRPKTE